MTERARFRVLLGLGAVLLCAFPLWEALWSGRIPGAGPDVVSTIWGMWWFQQTWSTAAWGGHSSLSNFPNGAIGSILSPSTAAAWAVLEPLTGPERAASLVVVGHNAVFALMVGWLARQVGVGRTGVAAAVLAVLVARLLPFGAGEGSIVAVAAVPIPLGLGALIRLRQDDGREGWFWAGVLAAAMAGAAAENPYLAPVLPAVCAVSVLWPRGGMSPRVRSGAALVLGSAAMLAVIAMFRRSASPNYPVEVYRGTAELGPFVFDVVDLPWARASPDELVWPGSVRWTLGAGDAAGSYGGRYLGLSVLALAGLSMKLDRARAWPWVAGGLLCAALGLGSLVYGVGGPFLYLNTVMELVARPLTQPTRFLIVALVCFSVAAAVSVDALLTQRRWPARAWKIACGALLFDAVVLGGVGLRLPTTELPGDACLNELGDGGVLTWPWDARDTELGSAQLLQIRHGGPAAQPGIASWKLHKEGVMKTLRQHGWRLDAAARSARLHSRGLFEMGFRFGVVDTTFKPADVVWMTSMLGPPVRECGRFHVYAISPDAPSAERPDRD